MAKKGVLIGINYPGSKDELQGCVNDVWRMHKCLIDRYGFAKEDIVVLIDTDKSYTQPTGKNIRDALSQLIKSARSGDVLFVHYSGHGMRLPLEAGKDDHTGFDECIIPCDLNLIPDDEFKNLVGQVPEGCHFTFVSDSCHSGGLIDDVKEQIGESTNKSTNKNRNRETQLSFFEFNILSFLHSILMKLFAICGIWSSPAEGDILDTMVKSREMPYERFITLLKQQTDKEDIEIGRIRPTLFDVFREDSSPAVKKFVKVMINKLKERNDQSGVLGKVEETALDHIEHNLNNEHYAVVKSDLEISEGESSNRIFPDRGILLSGCQTYETSADVRMNGEAYGAFSYAIQMVLSETEEVSKITNKDIVLRAREIMKKERFTQRPGLYCNDHLVDAPFIC